MLKFNLNPKSVLTIIVTLFVINSAKAAPFIGNYAVGAGETYTTLNAIYNEMRIEGLSGNTTIKVKNGTYTENLNWTTNIPGMSENATLTIESNSGNQSDVTLQSQSTYSLYISDNSYITFKNLTITQPNSQRTVYIRNSNNITLENCDIVGTLNTSSSTSYSVIYIQTNCSGIEIESCNISEGSYGMYTNSNISDVSVLNSTFKDHYYGMYFYNTTDLDLNNNTMSNIQSRGLYIYNSDNINCSNNNFSSG